MTAELDALTIDYAARHPDAFASRLVRGDAAEASRILLALPDAMKASIVARLPAGRILALLESGEHSPEAWLADAPFEDAVFLLSRMRRERRFALINALPDGRRRRQLLRHEQYPTHTIGWHVQDVHMRINAESPASGLVDDLRSLDSATAPRLVVIDADGRYAGTLDPWRILGHATVAGPVREYVTEVDPLYPEMPVASAVASKAFPDHNWLPVVDNRRRVLGGVSRAALETALSGRLPAGQGAADMFSVLFSDLVYLLGEVLEGLLVPGRSR